MSSLLLSFIALMGLGSFSVYLVSKWTMLMRSSRVVPPASTLGNGDDLVFACEILQR